MARIVFLQKQCQYLISNTYNVERTYIYYVPQRVRLIPFEDIFMSLFRCRQWVGGADGGGGGVGRC